MKPLHPLKEVERSLNDEHRHIGIQHLLQQNLHNNVLEMGNFQWK